MKRVINVMAIAVVLFASCTKNNTMPQNNNGNSNNSTIITGDFIITKFTDSNPAEDKTAIYNGYSFTFTSDGKITAVNNGATVEGSYTEKPAHQGEDAKLTINFSNTPLNELNKSWQIDLISNSAIHLSDDNTSSGEVLEFTAQ